MHFCPRPRLNKLSLAPDLAIRMPFMLPTLAFVGASHLVSSILHRAQPSLVSSVVLSVNVNAEGAKGLSSGNCVG